MLISSKVIELKAPFKATQQTQVVEVKNDTNASMAFKVKTTAPKLYCVRPNSGVLAPGDSEPVTIIFQGLPEEPALGSKCKDKFLFVSVPAPNDLIAKDVSSKWSELEKASNGNSIDVKLKVIFNYDNPMNTITEEEKSAHSIEPQQNQSIQQKQQPQQEQQQNTKSSSISKNITEAKQRTVVEEKPAIIEKEPANDLEPVKTTKSTGIAPPTIPSSVNSSNQTSIYFIAIIFIILAFLLSRFI